MSFVLNFAINNIEWLIMGVAMLFVFWRIQIKNKKQEFAKKVLEKAIATNANEPTTLHPHVDPDLCTGCASCTRVCPEGDILRMIDHKAVLVSPTKCVGHGECEKSWPMGAIKLVFGTKTRGMDLPRLTTNYETNVPGMYIAGELGGMGLIRNAVKQGVLAAKHALSQLVDVNQSADCDLFIVGAGPAGLAAGLAAVAQKKKYILIDQNTFGGTVYNFPRQKIVMTQPADLPVVGKMKFADNKVTKEELLAYWNEIRKRAGIQVRERVKFESLEKVGSIFKVKTSAGEFTARKVLLCMGVRGSPRQLGLKNEDLPKVTYNLIDPEQYQQKEIVVVGGGNAGVEAAQYLSKKNLRNKVKILVRGKDFDRCNEENKRIILEKQKSGEVEVWYQSEVKEIFPNELTILKEGTPHKVKNDYLFVFAGAELPFKFLMSLGVQIDKKFGEALQ